MCLNLIYYTYLVKFLQYYSAEYTIRPTIRSGVQTNPHDKTPCDKTFMTKTPCNITQPPTKILHNKTPTDRRPTNRHVLWLNFHVLGIEIIFARYVVFLYTLYFYSSLYKNMQAAGHSVATGNSEVIFHYLHQLIVQSKYDKRTLCLCGL